LDFFVLKLAVGHFGEVKTLEGTVVSSINYFSLAIWPLTKTLILDTKKDPGLLHQ